MKTICMALLKKAILDYTENTNNNEVTEELLYDLNLTVYTGTRKTRALGTYRRRNRLITINLTKLNKINEEYNRSNTKLLDNVIRHELAHHIDWCIRNTSHHDTHFRRCCNNIGMLDTNTRTAIFEDKWND